jgi:phosphatidylserine decarboxylase
MPLAGYGLVVTFAWRNAIGGILGQSGVSHKRRGPQLLFAQQIPQRNMVSEPNALSQTLALFSPIHKDGYKFIVIAAGITIVAFSISSALGLAGAAATLALALFFRDPPRMVPVRDGIAVAPADGTVIAIRNAPAPAGLGLGSEGRTCVSIFLSLLDVHVVRSPVAGRIETSFYRPGGHGNAASPRAPEDNECCGLAIETKNALHFGTVLVAGTVARRIVISAGEGDTVTAGERIGIIRFGSRVDVYLPSAQGLLVEEGQRMIAGETVIADLDLRESRRLFRRI